MRVIAGELKAREFKSPSGHKTHPMSDKMRGAIFNILGDIEGLTFMDAFAGSGALAFEAISRGASYAQMLEKDRLAAKIIAENIKNLNLAAKAHITNAAAGAWSDNNQGKQFDILLFDPPYDDLQLNLIQKLIRRHLASGGLAVLSYPGKKDQPDFEGTEDIETKNYGGGQLIFYRAS